MGNQKLMAIVKPQPAVNNYNSYASDLSSACSQKVHLGGLNHSPRSLFVPTQVRVLTFVQKCFSLGSEILTWLSSLVQTKFSFYVNILDVE